MSRWFRFYTGVVDDPKAQMLAPEMFKHWVNVLCIAAQHGGELPAISVTAFILRLPEPKAASILAKLNAHGLLDKTEKSFKPHNWDARQYKHDSNDPTNADRQKKYRDKKRKSNGKSNGDSNGSNGSETVPTKRPDSTEAYSEARASDADAASDPRTRLFREGLGKLGQLTGKGPDACRSFVGKCLKAANDDAVIVLGLIEEAERNRVVDPSAWIAARLKGTTDGKQKNPIIQAAEDLCGRLASFDGPPRGIDELRGAAGEDSPRLLSHG